MRINLRVIAGAKKNLIKEEADSFKVYVTQPAIEGKANKAVISLLAEHFSVKKSQIRILRGTLSPRKVIEIK
ncbi:MAG: DUF167 domain-containing protein [Candidatus Omnitrophota bacterium]